MDKWQQLRADAIAAIDTVIAEAQKIRSPKCDENASDAERGLTSLAYVLHVAPEDREDAVIALVQALDAWVN